MLKNIRVVPLAAESLGVRSMCTYVETSDLRLLLDAGVSLCPNRFGLPPHPQELHAIAEARKRIAEAAHRVEVVTISHYHYDHHTPSFEDWLVNWTETDETAKQIYRDKVVLVKNPREDVNFSQRERGWMFAKTAGRHARKIVNVDGKSFTFGQTKLRFSEPVFHGSERSELGWVLMVTIEKGEEKFVFAPDVQGPMSNRPLQIITEEKPQLLMVGGPPLYLSPMKVSEKQLQVGLKNLTEIVARVPHVILDHHIIRDEEWRNKTVDLFYQTYKSGSILQTAAEFLGNENKPLEAMRKKLYAKDPPSKEFEKWKKTNDETKKHTRPPI
jgi:predicted metallo-beta-lactamase superfamily hydrolase